MTAKSTLSQKLRSLRIYGLFVGIILPFWLDSLQVQAESARETKTEKTAEKTGKTAASKAPSKTRARLDLDKLSAELAKEEDKILKELEAAINAKPTKGDPAASVKLDAEKVETKATQVKTESRQEQLDSLSTAVIPSSKKQPQEEPPVKAVQALTTQDQVIKTDTPLEKPSVQAKLIKPEPKKELSAESVERKVKPLDFVESFDSKDSDTKEPNVKRLVEEPPAKLEITPPEPPKEVIEANPEVTSVEDPVVSGIEKLKEQHEALQDQLKHLRAEVQSISNRAFPQTLSVQNDSSEQQKVTALPVANEYYQFGVPELKTGTVISELSAVRAGPGFQHFKVLTLHQGETIPVRYAQGDWTRVVTPTGVDGWVRTETVKVN